jgi:putative ABC transport system permease protein
LTESLLLAVAGGALGTAFAFAVVRFLLARVPNAMPRIADIGIDWRVLGFSLGVTTVTGIAFGLAPALTAAHGKVGESLRVAARQLGRRRRRMQNIALGAQIATTVVLLGTAAVLGKHLQSLLSADPGFRANGVLTMSVTAPSSRYGPPAALREFYQRVEDNLSALPGVVSVGATSNLPFTGRNQTLTIEMPGEATPDSKTNVQRRSVWPDYFATMEIPFRAGRNFSRDDAADSVNSTIVDEAMARALWPGESAIGKTVKAYNRSFTVVGIVGSARHTRLDAAPQPTMYFPYSRMGAREVSIVLRTQGDPRTLIAAARRAIWSVDANIPLPKVTTLTDHVARSASSESFRTLLLGAFGISALLLTCVGILGVTARAVAQGRHEIGIRRALGAGSWAITRTILGNQGGGVALGMVIGIGLAIASRPLFDRFVVRTGAGDAWMLGASAAVLVTACAAAVLGPIRAALRVSPARFIRDD